MITPTVGMGVTYCVGSDRYPYTVVEVVSHRKIIVQADQFTRTDRNGLSESQRYDFERNTDAPKVILTFRSNGRWVRMRAPKNSSIFWQIGVRSAYLDPSF